MQMQHRAQNLREFLRKVPKGSQVWYSSDARRLPIKISSKVVVGNFTAKLRKATKLKSLND